MTSARRVPRHSARTSWRTSTPGAPEEAQINKLGDITEHSMWEGHPDRCFTLLVALDELIIPNENEFMSFY